MLFYRSLQYFILITTEQTPKLFKIRTLSPPPLISTDAILTQQHRSQALLRRMWFPRARRDRPTYTIPYSNEGTTERFQ